jgi:hypothetical protein
VYRKQTPLLKLWPVIVLVVIAAVLIAIYFFGA